MKSILYPTIAAIAIIISVYFIYGGLESYFQELLTMSKSKKLNYAIISLLVLSADIVLPVPSSIVMYINGLVLGFSQGVLLSVISVFISSTIGYYLGRFSSWGLKSSSSIKTEELIKKYGALGIILTRGIPILSESVCFTSGYNKLNFKVFSIINLIGYMPVCCIYAYFGTLGQSQNLFLLSFFSSILISLLLWFFGQQLLSRYILLNDKN